MTIDTIIIIRQMSDQHYEENQQIHKGQKVNQLLHFQPNNLLDFRRSSNQERGDSNDEENQIQEFPNAIEKIKQQNVFNTVSIKDMCNPNEQFTSTNQQGSEDVKITGESMLSELNSSINLQLMSDLGLNGQQENIFQQTFSKISQLQVNNKFTENSILSDVDNPSTPRKPNNDQSNDLQTLKKQLNDGRFTENFKHKKTNKMNKTVFNTDFKNRKQGDDKFTYEDEIKMLIKMGASKKKQSLILLKQWDKKHVQKLDFHQNVVEYFLNQIDKRLRSSIQNFQIYQVFFRQRVKQQEKYLSSNIFNIQSALKNSDFQKPMYQEFQKIIFKISKENEQKNDRIKDFIHLINNNILKDLIFDHSTQSQKQLLRMRQKISSLKTMLKTLSEQVHATKQVIYKMVELREQERKDLYSTQLRLMRRVVREAVVQKEIGQLVLQYYHKAIGQDIKKSEVIRQSLLTYSKGLNQAYYIDIDKEQIEQMSKAEQKKLILQLYSFQQIFDDGHIRMLKKINNFSKQKIVEFDDFQKYLKNFSIKKIDIRMSMLKDYNTMLVQKDKEIKAHIVITVDNFLLIFKEKQTKEQFTESDVSIVISTKHLQIKVINTESVQIIKKQLKKSSMISYFWDSKNIQSYQIKFIKRDMKEEFLDTIKNLTLTAK